MDFPFTRRGILLRELLRSRAQTSACGANWKHEEIAVLPSREAKTFQKLKVPEEVRSVMGNVIVRYGCVVLVNGDFPIDEKDPKLVNLKRLDDELLAQMGENPPLLKFFKQPSGR